MNEERWMIPDSVEQEETHRLLHEQVLEDEDTVIGLRGLCREMAGAIEAVTSAGCSPAAFRRHVLPLLGKVKAAGQ